MLRADNFVENNEQNNEQNDKELKAKKLGIRF